MMKGQRDRVHPEEGDHDVTARPLLLLDIDGVLNVFGAWGLVRGPGDREGRLVPPGDGYRVAHADGWNLLIPTEAQRWVARLEAHLDIVWSTMWEAKAVEHFAPIAGFGTTWDWIDFTAHAGASLGERWGVGVGDHKHAGIVATAGDRPAAVVDDDLAPVTRLWASAREDEGIPTLTIKPDPAVGLTAADVDAVMEFARRVAESAREPKLSRRGAPVGGARASWTRRLLGARRERGR
jgi:hypothetical protein